MKKTIGLLLFIILCMTSCVIGTSNEGHLDDMLQGKWQINHEMRYVSFKENVFEVTDSLSITEFSGTFENDKIPTEPPMWIWENSSAKISVTWNVNDSLGTMAYVNSIGDCNQKILVVSGFPFSRNAVDTLYQKKD